MFHVTNEAGALEAIELRDDEAGSRVTLAPARGGMVTRMFARGRDVQYLDEGTLRDPGKSVRGGNPVLFPSPGKLERDAWSQGGRSGALKQHGLARLLPWEVTGTSVDAGASVSLSLRATPETLAAYPWDFHAVYTYTLRASTLRIDLRFTNGSESPMPFGAGFHPYFQLACADKAAAAIGTRATRAYDNVAREQRPLTTIALADGEVDLHLEDHGTDPCTLRWPGGAIALRGSPEMSRWVVWTLPDKDFVCVEPWTCAGDALNTGRGLLWIAPGETRALWVEYDVLR